MSNDSLQQKCQEVCDATMADDCGGTCPSADCAAFAAAQIHFGCGDEYAKYFDCWVGAADICSPECSQEASDATDCFVAFCTEHPTDPACQTD